MISVRNGESAVLLKLINHHEGLLKQVSVFRFIALKYLQIRGMREVMKGRLSGGLYQT